MSMDLRLRIVVGVLVGGILVIAFASALQFRNLALALEGFGPEQPDLPAKLIDYANAAALGLALMGVLMLIVGVAIARSLRHSVLDRLGIISTATAEIMQGERSRRVNLTGDDELARIARVLDAVLDDSDRREAESRGHNREVRALLVALLHRWPKSAAVTGIDGEIIVSTLSVETEQVLRSLTPRVRAAAKILLSRGFLTASELETEIAGPGYLARVQALALGEQRIVGWLAVFEQVEPSSADEPVPPDLVESSDPAEPAGDVSQ
jgi:hypothetical protein